MSTHEEPAHAFPVEGKTFGLVAEVPRLQRGALNLVDIATSTMANIAPAMSFFFSFALIAAVAGVASPLTIVVATIAIALLGNTLAEFSRSIPSTGSFITFIGKTFGPVMAIATTLVVSLGYIIAMASVVDISGGWTQIILQHYLHIAVPWQPLTLILTAIVFYLMVRGVNLSTRWAGFFFLLEMVVLVVVSVIALVTNAAHLSLAPFNPANIKGGLAGLGLGFPVAVYNVHRVGELGGPGRGDQRPAAQRAQSDLRQPRADGGQLPAVRVRHGRRLPLQHGSARGRAGAVY